MYKHRLECTPCSHTHEARPARSTRAESRPTYYNQTGMQHILYEWLKTKYILYMWYCGFHCYKPIVSHIHWWPRRVTRLQLSLNITDTSDEISSSAVYSLCALPALLAPPTSCLVRTNRGAVQVVNHHAPKNQVQLRGVTTQSAASGQGIRYNYFTTGARPLRLG
jgi:hypothetical protein